MNILEIIGNKLNAVAVWIARLREPETPYAAAKPSPNPIMNPITEFSEKIPIFFFNAFVSARLFKAGILSMIILKGSNKTAADVIK